MPRCEKCGYPRATDTWCTSCGSKNPYPIRKWTLRGLLVLALIAIVALATIFAQKAGKERAERQKDQSGSFRMER